MARQTKNGVPPETARGSGSWTRRVPTIRDVAIFARVAPATVSNVLSGRRSVRPELCERVRDAIAAIGYQPNQLASSLRRRRSNAIGIIVPDFTNPFFAGLVHHIEDLAAQDGYDTLIAGSNEDEEREATRLQTLLARRIDGLIMAPARDEVPALAALKPRLPPTVLVDRGVSHVEFDMVTVANADATRMGCRHLLDLGHVDIAFVISSLALSNMGERVAGYHEALTAAGFGGQMRVVEAGFNVDACHNAVVGALRAEPRPTAIFAANYVANLGAMKAIRSLSLDFPREISLLGFDDTDWMTVLQPYLSVIAQPIAAIAKTAWRLLSFRLQATGPEPGQHVRLPCDLILRNSTCTPQHAVDAIHCGGACQSTMTRRSAVVSSERLLEEKIS